MNRRVNEKVEPVEEECSFGTSFGELIGDIVQVDVGSVVLG